MPGSVAGCCCVHEGKYCYISSWGCVRRKPKTLVCAVTKCLSAGPSAQPHYNPLLDAVLLITLASHWCDMVCVHNSTYDFSKLLCEFPTTYSCTGVMTTGTRCFSTGSLSQMRSASCTKLHGSGKKNIKKHFYLCLRAEFKIASLMLKD